MTKKPMKRAGARPTAKRGRGKGAEEPATIDTDRLMEIALGLAGLPETPGDSAVHHSGTGIRRILMGIDIRSAELQLAANLGYDVAVAHHPIGGDAVLRFHEVLLRHVDQMTAAGVSATAAWEAVDGMVRERRALAAMANFDHDPSIARLLGVPFLNVHTPLDEIGRRRMAEAAGALSEDDIVGDLVDCFYDSFGEFRHAPTRIEVRAGRADRPVGRIAVSHGAGTNGGYRVAKAYFDHGIDTLIYIHCRPADSNRLTEEYGDTKTLVVTGHIASDSIGINPYVNCLRSQGLEVTTISGIISG